MSARVTRCAKCDQLVRWGRTILGTPMPVDYRPDRQHGTVELLPNGTAMLVSEDLRRDMTRLDRRRLYVPHTATCPNPERGHE